MTRVTLLTDFGTGDGYAAAMAAVIAAQAPNAVVDHASHAIEPGDIFGATLALSRYAAIYPEGSVHVVVVDPGVGTERRAIAGHIDGRYYVAPDNGVLSLILQGAERVRLVEVTNPDIVRNASDTFHGRDIFAPAAARLASGAELESLGPPVRDPVLPSVPQPTRTEAEARGEVIHVDRFGNLITNIPGAWLRQRSERQAITAAESEVGPLRRTYGDVEAGALVALVGSTGLLEISVRDGSAAERLDAGVGAAVTASWQ